jgi:hypothetical protein
MRAHDGRVDHLDGGIMSGGKRAHDPIPYSGPSPPDEAVVAGGAWAIANRQIAPWCGFRPIRTCSQSKRLIWSLTAAGS